MVRLARHAAVAEHPPAVRASNMTGARHARAEIGWRKPTSGYLSRSNALRSMDNLYGHVENCLLAERQALHSHGEVTERTCSGFGHVLDLSTSNVRMHGRSRVSEGSSRFRISVARITVMNALQRKLSLRTHFGERHL
jgi:hypothetical protein